MGKFLKIIAVISLITILSFGLLLLYAYNNLDNLKQLALVQLNQQLKAEIKADSIDVTFYHTFPKISLKFTNFTVSDYLNKNKNLLKANSVFLGFDMMEIINKKYNIETIKIDSGNISVVILKNGKKNFDILKGESNESSKGFNLNLNKVVLNNVAVTYTDYVEKLNADINISQSEFRGNFSDDEFKLDINLVSFINSIGSNNKPLITNKDIKVNTAVFVNTKQQLVKVDNTKLEINKLSVLFNGKLFTEKNKNNIDLTFKTSETSIQELISILPIEIPEEFYKYKSSGNVFFNGDVKGLASNANINVNFGVSNGALTEPNTNLSLTNINFEGNFTNGAKRNLESSVLKLANLKATIANKQVKANCTISNFSKPYLNLEANGSLDVNFLVKFFKVSDVEKIDGTVDFNIVSKGNINANIVGVEGNNGSIVANINHAKFKNIPNAFSNISAKLELNSHLSKLVNLNFNYNKSNYAIVGSTNSINSFLFEPNLKIVANVNVNTNLLNLQDWIFSSSASKDTKPAKPINYQFNMTVNADELRIDNFMATKVSTKIDAQNDLVNFNDLNLTTCDGKISASGSFYHKNKTYYLTTNNAKLINLNIKKLFTAFDNFGQDEIKAQHINGILNSNIEFVCAWNENFDVLLDKVYVFSTIKLSKGELLNYKPLLSLSKFVNINDLNNLKFSELSNTIEVKNKEIIIPQMDILNNALNITLSGKHNFDNVVDYKVKLNLSELLTKKRTEKENEFGEEDEKGKGLNLFLSMSGPIDNLKITYDKKTVSKKLKEDIKVEKKNITDILKQELGIGKKDSSLKKLEKKKNNDELEFEN